MLTGFFKEAPQSLWPRAVVIEHLSKDEWQHDCIADMRRAAMSKPARRAAIRCWCEAELTNPAYSRHQFSNHGRV